MGVARVPLLPQRVVATTGSFLRLGHVKRRVADNQAMRAVLERDGSDINDLDVVNASSIPTDDHGFREPVSQSTARSIGAGNRSGDAASTRYDPAHPPGGDRPPRGRLG